MSALTLHGLSRSLTLHTGDGYSSTWIGIEQPELDKTLIQAGTEQDVINGRESYSAWYEMLPSFAVNLPDINVSPGDVMVSSISLINSDTNQWNIQISDASTGQGFNRDFNYNSSRSSGEWIMERPEVSDRLSTLADFGSITFTNGYLNVNNTVGTIGNFSFYQINMFNSQNSRLTSVSSLTNGGSSFTVSLFSGQIEKKDYFSIL